MSGLRALAEFTVFILDAHYLLRKTGVGRLRSLSDFKNIHCLRLILSTE